MPTTSKLKPKDSKHTISIIKLPSSEGRYFSIIAQESSDTLVRSCIMCRMYPSKNYGLVLNGMSLVEENITAQWVATNISSVSKTKGQW